MSDPFSKASEEIYFISIEQRVPQDDMTAIFFARHAISFHLPS